MKKLKTFTIIGILSVLITGTISHFVYDWTGKNFFAGLFFPINESVWEHMKLVFFPTLLYAWIMKRKLASEFPCIYSALAGGILTGTFSVPVLFYTYTGILGYDVPVLDIGTFILSVLIAFCVIYRCTPSCRLQRFAIILHALTGVLFISFLLFSMTPPSIGLFQDPSAPR